MMQSGDEIGKSGYDRGAVRERSQPTVSLGLGDTAAGFRE
jgi:hypothetical protein